MVILCFIFKKMALFTLDEKYYLIGERSKQFSNYLVIVALKQFTV